MQTWRDAENQPDFTHFENVNISIRNIFNKYTTGLDLHVKFMNFHGHMYISKPKA